MICGKLSSGWGEIFIKRNTFSSSIFFSDLLFVFIRKLIPIMPLVINTDLPTM